MKQWIALKDGACYEEVLKIWKRPLTSMPAYTEDTSMPLLDHPFKPPMKQKTIKDNLLMGSDTRRLCLSRQKRARVIAKTPESCKHQILFMKMHILSSAFEGLSWEIYSFTTSVGEPRTMGIIHFTSFGMDFFQTMCEQH